LLGCQQKSPDAKLQGFFFAVEGDELSNFKLIHDTLKIFELSKSGILVSWYL